MLSILRTVIVVLSICKISDQQIVPTNTKSCLVHSKKSLGICIFKSNVILTAVVVMDSGRTDFFLDETLSYRFLQCRDDAAPLLNDKLFIFSTDIEGTDGLGALLFHAIDHQFNRNAYVAVNVARDIDAPVDAPIQSNITGYLDCQSHLIMGFVMGKYAPSLQPLLSSHLHMLEGYLDPEKNTTTTFGVQLDAVRLSYTNNISYSKLERLRLFIIKQHNETRDWNVRIPQLYKHMEKIYNFSRVILQLSEAVHHQLVTDPTKNVNKRPQQKTTTTPATTTTTEPDERNGLTRSKAISWLIMVLICLSGTRVHMFNQNC